MERVRRGGTRRDPGMKGRGMKDHVDKSRGIVTLIPETLPKIKTTQKVKLIRFLGQFSGESMKEIYSKKSTRGVHGNRSDHDRIREILVKVLVL